jgi:tetratricopeptide (TPR) repeat protein
MVSAAYDAFHRGDLNIADDLAREAFDATRSSEPAQAAWAQMARANVAASRGNLANAISTLEDVASWLPDTSVYDRHTVHSIIALYTSLTDDSEKALASARIALDAAHTLGQPSALALALYANGMVLAEVDVESARHSCEQSIELTEQGASDVVYANAFGTLAIIATRAGNVREALQTVRRSIAYAHSIGDRPPMIGTLHTAGQLLAPFADPERFAVLAGGILDGWFKPMSNIIRERDRLPEAALVEVEAVLGTDRYRTTRARGAAMSYDELVSLVLAELDAALAALD